jgi:hypothetical protein
MTRVCRHAASTIQIVLPSIWEYFPIMMIQQLRTGSSDQHRSLVIVGLLILLCIGVLAQTLGAPVTLWNPVETADPADPLTTSLLEAFSIPSAVSPLSLLSSRIGSADFQSPLHSLLLVSGLFHPPSA